MPKVLPFNLNFNDCGIFITFMEKVWIKIVKIVRLVLLLPFLRHRTEAPILGATSSPPGTATDRW